ncbi:MAG: hypothetical protein IKX22_12505 [Prevotella sp.]|nr:hypothetical protein [Prevotella sp.]
MEYKRYLQPAIEITESERPRLITASRGWAKDGEAPIRVVKEAEVKESDLDPSGEGYGGFLDLD